MKKIVLVLAAAASFAAAPAHATYYYGGGHHGGGCGEQGEQGCESPLTGGFTYTGNGGDIRDLKTLTTSINVADSFIIGDVNLSLNELEHSFWGDLNISLSHGGTTVWLSKDQGGGRDATGNYVFDDAAANQISSTHYQPGTYRSFDLLSAFNGMDSAGLWTLKIYDDAYWDNGELCDWTLQLAGTPTSEVPEPATWLTMIAGFGLVGVQMRRRKMVPATVRA